MLPIKVKKGRRSQSKPCLKCKSKILSQQQSPRSPTFSYFYNLASSPRLKLAFMNSTPSARNKTRCSQLRTKSTKAQQRQLTKPASNKKIKTQKPTKRVDLFRHYLDSSKLQPKWCKNSFLKGYVPNGLISVQEQWVDWEAIVASSGSTVVVKQVEQGRQELLDQYSRPELKQAFPQIFLTTAQANFNWIVFKDCGWSLQSYFFSHQDSGIRPTQKCLEYSNSPALLAKLISAICKPLSLYHREKLNYNNLCLEGVSMLENKVYLFDSCVVDRTTVFSSPQQLNHKAFREGRPHYSRLLEYYKQDCQSSDIWALGVLLCSIIFRKVNPLGIRASSSQYQQIGCQFEAVRELNQTMPGHLGKVALLVNKMLSVNPRQRPSADSLILETN